MTRKGTKSADGDMAKYRHAFYKRLAQLGYTSVCEGCRCHIHPSEPHECPGLAYMLTPYLYPITGQQTAAVVESAA